LGALSARENVEVVMNLAGRPGKAARLRAIELLTLLGLDHRLDHLPADLSGGENQRVAIARALANEAPLILADEPTGNLDSKSGKELMLLLRQKLANEQGKAIVVVTHDHRLKEIADRVLWLEDGVLSSSNGDLQFAMKH
jgi:putative ABC transport system ATP-binding protein